MKRLIRRDYLPAIEGYAAELSETIQSVESVIGEGKAHGQRKRLDQICEGAHKIHELCDKLHAAHYEARDKEDAQARADAYAEQVIPVMNELRHWVDEMETITEHKHWPCPTYNEILFYC